MKLRAPQPESLDAGHTLLCASLAAVVGGGLGVDEEAVDLGRVQFECSFQGGHDGVDASHGKAVGQGAVAGDLGVLVMGAGNAVGVRAAAGYVDLVDVEDLGEGCGDAVSYTHLTLPTK